MARSSFFRENGQNNPNFLNNMRQNDIKRSIKRIILDVVNDNIIDEDYIYFTNIRLINFGMEEAIKNIRYAQTEYNCAYYYSNSPYYQYNGLIDAPEGGNVQKIIATAITKMKAWETVYQCFQSLSLGNDPKWVFQYIRGNDNNILKSL